MHVHENTKRSWIFTILLLLPATAARSADSPDSYLADIGPAPEVRLIDAREKPFDLSSLRGKAVLVSFIYTTCNGACPATTLRLSLIQHALETAGLWGSRVEFVSITLDPSQDVPEVLRRYASLYDAEPDAWHFLTGPPDQVNEVIASWDMWVRRTDQGALDHPSRVFLVDPRGHQREIYNLDFLQPKTVVRDVRAVLAGSEGP